MYKKINKKQNRALNTTVKSSYTKQTRVTSLQKKMGNRAFAKMMQSNISRTLPKIQVQKLQSQTIKTPIQKKAVEEKKQQQSPTKDVEKEEQLLEKAPPIDQGFVNKAVSFFKTYAADMGELAIGLIPIIGDVYDAMIGIIGYSPITGQKLDALDRLLSIAGAIPIPFVSGKVLRMAKGIVQWILGKTKITKILRYATGKASGFVKKMWNKVSSFFKNKFASKIKKADPEVPTKKTKIGGGDKATELPIALGMAKTIEAAHDAKDSPVPLLLASLNTLKKRFTWIKKFSAKPTGPNHYKIVMHASENDVGDYTDGKPRLKLTKSAKRKLGNLINIKDKDAAQAILDRGGNASNVNKALGNHLREKTVGEIAQMASEGDKAAESALKIIKQAAKKGAKY
ncbi:pre-toxin TG domain-containing protein [Candidatus Uabimicrobium sp. HlEnr_7]|uniref:pre-toxin TG domain-containing protein n=1 Tax=Candidatus Uabimicrobium helgolandensis TaxID=3095367 RepID=UPI0035568B1A